MLLDTQIFLALLWEEIHLLSPSLREAVLSPQTPLYISVASIWEIAIKFRLGKLELKMPLQAVPTLAQDVGLGILRIEATHVLAPLDPLPATRDPFDRLLLAQCAIDGLRLITTDRVLAQHPLAWRAG
jgi:PIN domain nuclease of toxin-antitoxin system